MYVGNNMQDLSRGLLVQFYGGMIHGPRGRGWQLELLKLELKVLKNTRWASMSLGPCTQVLFLGGLPCQGRNRHLKNSSG